MKVKKAVIPLAGLATRFLPVTKSIPKEILPIGGFPVIHWVVKELVDAGIEQILLITNTRSLVFERYFSSEPWLEQELTRLGKQKNIADVERLLSNCEFFYAHQTRPEGIGEAILTAEGFVGSESFYCHMGDSFFSNSVLSKKMLETHEGHQASCTIGTRKLGIQSIMAKAHAVVESTSDPLINKLVEYREKPAEDELTGELSSIGRFVFSSKIFQIIRTKKANNELNHQRDFGKLLNALLDSGTGYAVEAAQEHSFYDAGDLNEYYKTLVRFLIENDDKFVSTLENLLSQHMRQR